MFKKLNSGLPLSALSLLVIASASGFALESNRLDALEARVAQLTQDNTQDTKGGKNPTTRMNGYNQGAFLFADLLYWQASLDGIEYGLASHSPMDPGAFLGAGDVTISHGELKDINFGWGPGFRVGLGYNFNYDQWDLLLDWTRWHHRSSSSSGVPSGGSLSALWIPVTIGGGDVQRAHAHWHLLYDTADLELGREFYLTQGLSARPFAGVRAAFIHQHMKFKYQGAHLIGDTNLFDINTIAKNEYSAGGLRMGTAMNFRMNQHWSLYGAAAAAVLYGHFDVKLNFQFPGQDLGGLKLGYKAGYNRVQANLEGAIGLQWETGYAGGKYRFAISACYEFTEWFNQNQLLKALAPALFNPAFLPNDGDLGMQGGTLSARFDF